MLRMMHTHLCNMHCCARYSRKARGARCVRVIGTQIIYNIPRMRAYCVICVWLYYALSMCD